MGLCASSPAGFHNKASAIVGLHRDSLISSVLQAAAHCSSVHFPAGLVDGKVSGALLNDGTVVAAPTLQDLHADPAKLVAFLAAISPELAKPTEPDAILDTALEVVAIICGILTKLGGPPQKKLRKAAMPLLKRFQAVAGAAPRDPMTKAIVLSPLTIIVSSAALCWLIPACAYMRWFRPLEDKAADFPALIALTATLRSLSGWRDASSFESHWLNPSVIPRPGAMAMGPMQHAAMRFWIKYATDTGKDIATKLHAVLDTPVAAAAGASGSGDESTASIGRALVEKTALLSNRFSWFAKLLDTHSVMEDSVIYPKIEETSPGSSKTPTEEHEHEVPLINGIAATFKTASDKMVELLGDADTIDMSDDEARTAVESLLAALEGEHSVTTTEPGVELHFQGEERDIFPVMQSLPGPVKKKVFVNAFAVCKPLHATLLAFVVGGLNPAMAEQYMWGLRKHAPLTDDEWRVRVGYLKAGVAEGKISKDKYDMLYKRAACVRDFAAAPLEA